MLNGRAQPKIFLIIYEAIFSTLVKEETAIALIVLRNVKYRFAPN